MKGLFTPIVLLFVIYSQSTNAQTIWDKEKAKSWYQTQKWLCGANFIPSSAVNQLEMWQKETFDPQTIDRELGYGAAIGLNVMRVYLHHEAWVQDSAGFKQRIAQYLQIADSHKIKTMFVFFDDCWRDEYHGGPQAPPIPCVHNSRWLKDPGSRIDREPELMDTLQNYVLDILNTLKDDQRIIAWDLYNEPGHFGHGDKSWPLLKNVVTWARSVQLSQPITIGIWNKDFKDFNKFQLENSDVISFHNYRDSVSMKEAIDSLKKYDRPLFCTEYMKRVNQSTFTIITPMLKKANIAAINWGLVAGKTQTNYPQGNKGGEEEPKLWYHDIFHQDGRPFDDTETVLLQKLCLER